MLHRNRDKIVINGQQCVTVQRKRKKKLKGHVQHFYCEKKLNKHQMEFFSVSNKIKGSKKMFKRRKKN